MNDKITFISEPLDFFASMLSDIEKAKQYIYFEVYIFENDSIGEKFRNVLTKKAKQGVEVNLLIDSWGATVNKAFFSEFISYGGDVKFFKKINLNFNFFTESHRRDHRKILAIDDNISYIGSANITIRCLNWRESMFRIEGAITRKFKDVITKNIRIYNKYLYEKRDQIKYIIHDDYQIIRDVPSIRFQQIKKRFIQLIKEAKQRIIIETPYFLPGTILRRELLKTAGRGVEIKIIIPIHSDIVIVDLLRSRYFGQLYRAGIKVYFYLPQFLHSKIMIIDEAIFAIGSANFDYRSFRYQFEIVLSGKNQELVSNLSTHLNASINDSTLFSYENWRKRPLIQKVFERLFVPFRHIF